MSDRSSVIAQPERLDHAWNALKPFWAHLRPDQATIERCRDYATQRRRQGRSDGTIHVELGMLGTALRWAWKRGFIDRQIHIELPPKPRPKDRWLTKAEANRLLAAASTHCRLFILLALHTAARSEAILELTWDRVDLQRGLIDFNTPVQHIRAKRRAKVPINKTLKAALSAAAQIATCDYVVAYGGKQVGSIKKAMARAAERAGLTGITPHVLRHTSATWMAQHGVKMREIAGYLGHSDSRTTERVYAHHHPDFLKEAADALDDFGSVEPTENCVNEDESDASA